MEATGETDDVRPSSRLPTAALVAVAGVWAVYFVATGVAQGKYVGVTAFWCLAAIVLVHAVVAAVTLMWLQRPGTPVAVQVLAFFCVLVPLPLPAAAVLGVLAARAARPRDHQHP